MLLASYFRSLQGSELIHSLQVGLNMQHTPSRLLTMNPDLLDIVRVRAYAYLYIFAGKVRVSGHDPGHARLSKLMALGCESH